MVGRGGQCRALLCANMRLISDEDTVKIRNITTVKIFDQTVGILKTFFTFIFRASPATEVSKNKKNVINSELH